MIPNDPKSALREQLSFQSGPLILSHLGPLVGALKRPASAVRSRLWPPFRINNLHKFTRSLRYAEAFLFSSNLFIFNVLQDCTDDGRKKAGVAHWGVVTF